VPFTQELKYIHIVEGHTKYFVEWQQYKGNQSLHFCSKQWSFIVLTVTCSSVHQRALTSVLPWQCSQYFLYYRQQHMWLNNINKINCCISIAKMVMSTRQTVTYCIQCLSCYILCTTNNYWYGWNFRPNCKCTNRNTIHKFWRILIMTQYT